MAQPIRSIVFRCDASPQIGLGHLMRCRSLALAAIARGVPCGFVVRDEVGCPFELLDEPGLQVAKLAGPHDAPETRQAAVAFGFDLDLLVVDHYGLKADWEAEVGADFQRVLAIDDLANRSHEVDLLLDQNSNLEPCRYDPFVPATTRRFLGPSFALLRPEFRAARPATPQVQATVERIAVSMGGADSANATHFVVDSLLSRVTGVQVDVVVGSAYPRLASLQAAVEGRSDFRLHVNPPNLVEILSRADLAIGAAGSTTWERACLGIPSLVVTVADNQENIAGSMDTLGVLVYAGRLGEVSKAALGDAIEDLMLDYDRRASLARNSFETVDGRGAERLLRQIESDPIRAVIVSDHRSWVTPYLERLTAILVREGHETTWLHDMNEVPACDVCFYLSWQKITPPDILARARHNIVVHASDLPKGRGMSPMPWQILEGKSEIVVSMLEAVEGLDCGDVYRKRPVRYRGTELLPELQSPIGELSVELPLQFVHDEEALIQSRWVQEGESSSFSRRRPADSVLDPERTIADQFDLLRICDNENFPAWFEHRGRRYKLLIVPDDRNLKPPTQS